MTNSIVKSVEEFLNEHLSSLDNMKDHVYYDMAKSLMDGCPNPLTEDEILRISYFGDNNENSVEQWVSLEDGTIDVTVQIQMRHGSAKASLFSFLHKDDDSAGGREVFLKDLENAITLAESRMIGWDEIQASLWLTISKHFDKKSGGLS